MRILTLFAVLISSTTLAKNISATRNTSIDILHGHVQNRIDELDTEWTEDELTQIYAQNKFNLNLYGHNFTANWILRSYQGHFFKRSLFVEPNNYAFPDRLVGRNFLKFVHTDESYNGFTQSTLNEFYYQWKEVDFTIEAGRVNVNFGSGYFLNPINPFNTQTTTQFHTPYSQGNDGLKLTFHNGPGFDLNIYIFGDKTFKDYEEQLTRTVMLHGNLRKANQLNIHYLLGEDQKRHKYGFEVSKRWKGSTYYAQFVKFSQRLDSENVSAQGLAHRVLGIERRFADNFKGRIEFAKNEIPDDGDLSSSFIFLERFMGLNLIYDLTDRQVFDFSTVKDLETDFFLFKLSYIYKLKDYLRLELFNRSFITSLPVEDGSSNIEKFYQPAQYGLALKANF